jgi:pimeloyl-ACP methyl ester carboxylesterase
MTPLCWEPMVQYFTQQGYTCLAPTWLHKDRPIEELRKQPPAALQGLGVAEIVDHYERFIREQAEPPMLIGHSFGGLFVQLLLDRGVGAAGVAIDPAPPRGVLPRQPSAFKAIAGVLSTWGGWRKTVYTSFDQFRYAFVHTLPEQEQRRVYETYVVPETGRIFFQTAFAPLAPHSPLRVNFQNATRAPLLLIAGEQDLIIPLGLVRSNFRKYHRSSARTDFMQFEGRTHWIIAQAGWEEVADAITVWLGQIPS